jgi:EAL domain-containing protein (putative c-di-GMP-specific phosphodiesterase class I)/FixJ family two-component response regulator
MTQIDADPITAGGGPQILVVDDQPGNIALLERILKRAGYERVASTTDGRDVRGLYSSLDPDLILLDLHMPMRDGFDVLADLTEVIPADSYVPVLVLTGDTSTEAKERALTAGARDFLVKPFDRTEVLLRTRNLLETRFLYQQLQARNAGLAAQLRDREAFEAKEAELRRLSTARVEDVLEHHSYKSVFQPIVDLRTGEVHGVEALTRFTAEPVRPPDVWFAEASAVGRGGDLEVAAIRSAVAELQHLPPGAYLSLNTSPTTAVAEVLLEALDGAPADRLVLEVTEHAQVNDYDALAVALAPLRDAGVRLAVDDAGAGFASLQHILRLNPDIIKLDISLTRDIDQDPVRRALASSLVTFADDVGATLTAEGIERYDELDTLRELGVSNGQGYYLARPGPLPVSELLVRERVAGAA